MTQPITLDGPRLEAGAKTQGLVVLLHGLGADGSDLIGLAPYLQKDLPGVSFVSPHAPFPCDMAPFGRQWFSLQDRGAETLLAGLRQAAEILDAFLDAEMKRYDLAAERVALLGFSQGAMLSLHAGLRRKQALGAILGFSGALIGPEALKTEIATRPRTLLVHGDADDVVPVVATHAAVSALSSFQVPVEVMIRPGLPHSIDETGLKRGGQVLKETILKS